MGNKRPDFWIYFTGDQSDEIICTANCSLEQGGYDLAKMHDIFLLGDITRQFHIDLGHFNNDILFPNIKKSDKILYLHMLGIHKQLQGNSTSFHFFSQAYDYIFEQVLGKSCNVSPDQVKYVTGLNMRESAKKVFVNFPVANKIKMEEWEYYPGLRPFLRMTDKDRHTIYLQKMSDPTGKFHRDLI